MLETPPGGTFFQLLRRGTGVVLEGCVFGDGTTVVRWCTDKAPTSTVVYGIEDGVSGFQRFMDIHVQSHHNDVCIAFQRGDEAWTFEQQVPVEARREKLYETLTKVINELNEISEPTIPGVKDY